MDVHSGDEEMPDIDIDDEGKSLYSRHIKVPLNEVPAYLEPFKYDWVRKLFFRTIKYNKNGKVVGPVADVCYISPDGQKFWTFKKLKQFLIGNPHGLTLSNFVYAPRPIGLNDETKEIFDYSRQKEVKMNNGESTEAPNLTFKIIKRRPIKHNIRRENASYSYRKIVKRKLEPKLRLSRVKKVKVDYSESSSNNAEISSIKSDNSNRTERFEKYFRQPNSMQALIDYHKSLQSIFSELEVADLLRVRLVCTTWRDIADKTTFWTKIFTDRLKITNWNGFSKFLESHKTKYLNLKGLVDIQCVDWEIAAQAIARTNITELEMSGCSAAVAEKISQKCTKLYSLSVTLTNPDTIDLNSLDKMNQHDNGEAMQVTYESNQGINLKGDLAPLLSLINLTHLTLKTLKNLTTLKLCDGISFSSTNIQDSRYLRLERLETRALISFNIIQGISSLTKLEHLELIDFEVEDNFDEHLKKCTDLKSLMLIPAYSVATSNVTILKGILNLKSHLKYVIWGVHVHHLRKSKTLLWRKWQADSQRDIEFIPILEPVPFLYLIDSNTSMGNKQEKNDEESTDSIIYTIKMLQLTQLEKLIRLAMPNTIVSILKAEKFRAEEPEEKEPKFYTVYT